MHDAFGENMHMRLTVEYNVLVTKLMFIKLLEAVLHYLLLSVVALVLCG